jgi:hypothetical protein
MLETTFFQYGLRSEGLASGESVSENVWRRYYRRAQISQVPRSSNSVNKTNDLENDMTQHFSRILVALVAVALLSSVSFADEKKSGKDGKKPKLSEVKIKDLTLKVPATWKQQPPANRLRLAQFEIPLADGDKEKPLLVVSSFSGGGLAQNIPRWKSEFRGEIKMTLGQGESPQGKYVIAALTGTHTGPGFRPRKKPLENGSVVTLIVMPKGKPYFYLKVTGPGKSVAAAAKALRTAIGADIKAEKKIEDEKK